MSEQFSSDSTKVHLLAGEGEAGGQNGQNANQNPYSFRTDGPPPENRDGNVTTNPEKSKFCDPKRVIINMGSGRQKQGHRCTVECLEKYPIHHLARIGRYKALKEMLTKHVEDLKNDPNPTPCKIYWPFEQDECFGRSPLHYAAATGNVEKGLLCTKLLLEVIGLIVPAEKRAVKLQKFVNKTDYNKETALHLAAKNEATNIVKELLLNQADLDISSHTGKCGLMEVYKRTPLAMNEALNQSIAYVELCRRELVDDDVDDTSKRKSSNENDAIDFTHSYVSVCLNFYPLLGSKVSTGRKKNGDPVPETNFLYKINRNRMESEVRRLMLNNVLVQAFLYFKWKKIKLFCFIAILLHVIWLALYILIVIDVFVVNCPYVTKDQNDEDETNSTVEIMGQANTDVDGNLNGLDLEGGGRGKMCRVNTLVYFSSALLILFSIGIAIKELFQFIRLRSLYIRFENLGQCTLLAFIFLSTPNFYLRPVSEINPIHYQISAVSSFLKFNCIYL